MKKEKVDILGGILNTNWAGYVQERDSVHDVKYYLNRNLVSDGYAWIAKEDMIKSFEVLDLHKVYIPEAAGTGQDMQILGTPFYGEPHSICSQTYICIGYDHVKHNLSKE